MKPIRVESFTKGHVLIGNDIQNGFFVHTDELPLHSQQCVSFTELAAEQLRDWLNEKYPVEALAKLKAERDAALRDWESLILQRDAAIQAKADREEQSLHWIASLEESNKAYMVQLAEAVELLRDAASAIDTLPGYPRGSDVADRIDGFLVRHAQAEQQESAR